MWNKFWGAKLKEADYEHCHNFMRKKRQLLHMYQYVELVHWCHWDILTIFNCVLKTEFINIQYGC